MHYLKSYLLLLRVYFDLQTIARFYKVEVVKMVYIVWLIKFVLILWHLFFLGTQNNSKIMNRYQMKISYKLLPNLIKFIKARKI